MFISIYRRPIFTFPLFAGDKRELLLYLCDSLGERERIIGTSKQHNDRIVEREILFN